MEKKPGDQIFWDSAQASVSELLAQLRILLSDGGNEIARLTELGKITDAVDDAMTSCSGRDDSPVHSLLDAVAANPTLRPKFELPDFSAEPTSDRRIVPVHEVAEIVRTLSLAHVHHHGAALDADSWRDIRSRYESYLFSGEGEHLADLAVPILGATFDEPRGETSSRLRVVRSTDVPWAAQVPTELSALDQAVAMRAEFVLLLSDVPVWVESIGRYHHMRPTDATRLEILQFFQALNLYCPGPATWVATAIRSPRWTATPPDSESHVEVIVERDFPSRIDAVSRFGNYSAYGLDGPTEDKVLEGSLRLASSHKSVRLAVERLSTSSSRSTDEDRIIDLCIGLEALLGAGSGAGEVVHRIALRGAAVLSRLGFGTSAMIYGALKQTYGYRSQVVHGSAGPYKKQLLHIDGTPIHASRFALASLTALARAAVETANFDPERLDEQFLFSAFDAVPTGAIE